MLSIDVFTCYAVAGAGSLVGLGLMTQIRTDQNRVRVALSLYHWAFCCLALLVLVFLSPEAWRPSVTQGAIGFAAAGVTLLAWAFRQLNGRRTPPALGWALTVMSALVLWVAAIVGSDLVFVQAVTWVFAALGVGLTIDQGWLILRSPRVHASELSLLAVAVGFALIWLLTLAHAMGAQGGAAYPTHWLYAPDWLLPITALSFAVLPLAVAAVVFAIINQRLNLQLHARALSDDLTGALSRRGLRELGERMLSMQTHQPNLVAVLMMDVDLFKAVNDTYGHQVGDDVLRQITQLTRERLRDDALLARYGGEEFTVLLPVRSHLEASAVAERLRQMLASTPCETRGGPVSITVSIGVAFHRPDRTLEDVLAQSDACLYEAKQAGRNRVVTARFEP
ncbi:MAG: GGDEF domain-containing protein [Aquabacterium sp.]|jgi:diguanylate cyclase (GGDEF)-like protein|uniref:GGDEF domain-containing protein n=1 Tax=Aquabacterium sp. TaxID=1872578 RepID=UPI001B59AE29|nr:GGDEF domain-containing protein [Aquabacterium sp.]MBP7132576.1 GGDEF domain-containing protein [Aquabacterium sp.]